MPILPCGSANDRPALLGDRWLAAPPRARGPTREGTSADCAFTAGAARRREPQWAVPPRRRLQGRAPATHVLALAAKWRATMAATAGIAPVKPLTSGSAAASRHRRTPSCPSTPPHEKQQHALTDHQNVHGGRPTHAARSRPPISPFDPNSLAHPPPHHSLRWWWLERCFLPPPPPPIMAPTLLFRERCLPFPFFSRPASSPSSPPGGGRTTSK